MASNQDADGLGKQLWEAASRGDHDQVSLALDQGANIEWPNTSAKADTPLIVACRNGHESVARLLLDRGASINATNQFQATCLHIAAQNGHESVARLLLERGASINAIDKDNWTSLYFAARTGHESVVGLLLERGASIDAVTKDNWTSLHIAAWKGHESVARLLLERGADTMIESVRQYPC